MFLGGAGGVQVCACACAHVARCVSPSRAAHTPILSLARRDTPLSLLGARIRRSVLTIHDDSNARIGFANVDNCESLAQEWELA